MTNARLSQMGALGGIVFVLLQLVSQTMLQAGGSEPKFDAQSAEIAQFFADRDVDLVWTGSFLASLSVIPFTAFVVVIWNALWGAESGAKIGSTTAMAFGQIVAVIGLIATLFWSMAIFRVDDGLSPEMSRTLFDLGNFTFATQWIAIGGFLLFTGISSLQTRVFATWIGWSSVVIALALLVGRCFWTDQTAFGPYVLYWIWLIVIGVILFIRARAKG